MKSTLQQIVSQAYQQAGTYNRSESLHKLIASGLSAMFIECQFTIFTTCVEFIVKHRPVDYNGSVTHTFEEYHLVNF